MDRLFRVFLPPHPPVSLFSSVVANVRPWAGKPGLEGPLPPALESFLCLEILLWNRLCLLMGWSLDSSSSRKELLFLLFILLF